ncbi:MAG TPA: hypothetical protein VFW83_10195, partial [Bryobacteraceae bacterium]|nr:hypothetical protein [Bryobacteraceae bacterium]
LTMRLDAPSPIAASGSITLAFQPDTSAALAKDDPTVVFTATGARSVPFSIQTGGTQALLAGQPEAIFQTGTTAGTITFTVSSNAALSGDSSATLKIPPEPVVIDLAGAYAEAGALNLEIRGFDNTYSAGTMSFTFYDTAGRTIAGPIQASFTASFHDYFLSSQYGGAFQALVKFPVIGDASQAGSVDLQMTNAAGSTATQHLIFLDDAPQCEKLPDGLACSP